MERTIETEESINYPLELNQTRQQLLQSQMQTLHLQMEKLKAEEQALREDMENDGT